MWELNGDMMQLESAMVNAVRCKPTSRQGYGMWESYWKIETGLSGEEATEEVKAEWSKWMRLDDTLFEDGLLKFDNVYWNSDRAARDKYRTVSALDLTRVINKTPQD
jgi:hypothetical protein